MTPISPETIARMKALFEKGEKDGSIHVRPLDTLRGNLPQEWSEELENELPEHLQQDVD